MPPGQCAIRVSKSAEAGVRFQPKGTSTSLGLSVFELRRENFLTTEGLVQRQIGEVRSRGIEREANASLMAGLNLVGAVSLYQRVITQGAELERGKRPPSVPESLAPLWLDYTVPDGVLGGLGAGVGARYSGSSFADRENIADATFVGGCSSETACFYGDRSRAMLNVGYTW